VMTNDVDDELTQSAVRHALEQYGQYFETVNPDEGARVERVGRVGRAVAAELGIELSMAANRRRDGAVQICLLVVRSPLEPEPA
jgi:hypothetical protein